MVSGWRVAVVPFENETGDSSLAVVGRMAAAILRHAVEFDNGIAVVSKGELNALLVEERKSEDVVQRLSREARATVVVTGNVYLKGDSLRIEVAATNTRTGTSLAAFEPQLAPRGGPVAAIESLGDRLLGALATDTASVNFTRAPKYSAYVDYDAAIQRFMRADMAEARSLFRRASARDSTFFIAYSMLATSYWNASMFDSSEVVLRAWAEVHTALTPSEYAQFEWHQALLAGDTERTLETTQRWATFDSTIPVYLTGLNANKSLRTSLALASLLYVDTLTARTNLALGFTIFRLADAYHLAGQYEAELASLERRRSQCPNDVPRLLARERRALGALRCGPKAIAVADTVLRSADASNAQALVEGINLAAMEFHAYGDSAWSAILARTVLAWSARHPTMLPPTTRAIDRGIAWLLTGTLDSAQSDFETAARDSSRMDAPGYLGLTLARRGNVQRARAIADSLGAIQRKWLFGENTLWRASLYAELGDHDDAVALLGRAYHEGMGKQHAHFLTQLRALHGYPPFEAFIRPR